MIVTWCALTKNVVRTIVLSATWYLCIVELLLPRRLSTDRVPRWSTLMGVRNSLKSARWEKNHAQHVILAIARFPVYETLRKCGTRTKKTLHFLDLPALPAAAVRYVATLRTAPAHVMTLYREYRVFIRVVLRGLICLHLQPAFITRYIIRFHLPPPSM